MTTYSLSVVQVCPEPYKVHAEAIAEAAGYGTGNLSVKLKDTTDNIYWGCHAWWIPEVFTSKLQEMTPEAQAVMSQVITSTKINTGEDNLAYNHWMEVLQANDLSIVEDIV